MNGKKTFNKKINRIQRTTARKAVKPVSAPVAQEPTDVDTVPTSMDVGDWRLAQDEDGSLILYNFSTGNKVVIARP